MYEAHNLKEDSDIQAPNPERSNIVSLLCKPDVAALEVTKENRSTEAVVEWSSLGQVVYSKPDPDTLGSLLMKRKVSVFVARLF